MGIIERINTLREERRTLLTEADTCEDMERLHAIRDRLNAINSQMDDMEALRDQMAEGARPMQAAPENAAPAQPTLGEQLQQVAAVELRRRGARIPGVEVRVNPRANTASGQNETDGDDGGYLLSPTVTTALLQSVRESSFFLPRVRHLSVGPDSNSLDMPYWPDKDRSNSNRYGGVKAYWMNEADQYTATQTKFATRSMKLTKLGALGYATEEILRDSRFLESIMMDAFNNAMTWEVDEAILFGAGTVSGNAAQPLGMLNGTASTGNAALITVAKETSQAAATVNMQNILKMWNRMDPASRSRAIWLINPDIELQLIQMTMQTGTISSAGESAVEKVSGTFGVPVYMPPNGLASAPYGTLLGRPVVPNEHMAVAGSLGDIAFVDPSEYFWIERDGIRQTTSVHVRFEYDEMAFKFTYRCNGMPSWYSVGTPAKGTTTRSPYVALAARS